METALERLMAERSTLRKERNYLFFANPICVNGKLNMMKWKCTFPGPNNDLYKDSYYHVTLTFTKDYPFKPPKVKFDRPVFHPNIYQCGSVCLDILSTHWKPSMNIMQILNGLQQLLSAPNNHSPANSKIMISSKTGKAEYERKVRENILMHHKMPNIIEFVETNK